MGFPGGSVVKNLPGNAADKSMIPGLGSSPGERNGTGKITVHGAANELGTT